MAKEKAKSKKSKKRYKVEFSNLSIFIWITSSIFILGWIFVLGILVGRGFLPTEGSTLSSLKEQIGRLPGVSSDKRTDQAKEIKAPEPDPKLAFYERLSSKKNAVKQRANTEIKDVKETKKMDLKGKSGSSQNNSSEKSVTRNIETQDEDKKTQSYDDKIKYTVQLASLGKKEGAESMIRQLMDKGYPAYYYMVKVNEKNYYRIRCGKFATLEEARNYAERLENEEGIKGFVSRFE